MMGWLQGLFSRSRLFALIDTAGRFPLSVVCAIAFVLLMLDVIFDTALVVNRTQVRPQSLCGLGFFAALAAVLVAEGRDWRWALGVLAGALALALIALKLFTDPADSERPILVTVLFLGSGLILLCMVAPFTHRQPDNDAFWAGNHLALSSAAFGLVSALISGAGLSALGAAIEVLLGIEVEPEFYQVVWLIALALLWPLIALGMLPRTFTGAQPNEPPAYLRWIAVFLLVPIASVYLAVVYVYAGKIAADGALPHGQVARVVCGFVAFGVVTFLIAHPWRAAKYRWLAIYMRWLFPALIVPLVLLVLAVAERVGKYGVTESRYFLCMVSLWLLVVVPLFAFGRQRLKILPGLLGALLILSSFGPWGATAVSTRSQVGQLEALLRQYGRLVDGRVVASGPEVPNPVAQRISSIVDYMRQTDKLTAIEPWFADSDTTLTLQPRDLLARLSIPYVPPSESFYIETGQSEALAVGEFHLIIHQTLTADSGRTVREPGGPRSYDLEFDALSGRFSVAAADGRHAAFDLAAMAAAALAAGYNHTTEADDRLRSILSAEARDEGLRARIVVHQLIAQLVEGEPSNLSGRLILLIADPGS